MTSVGWRKEMRGGVARGEEGELDLEEGGMDREKEEEGSMAAGDRKSVV